MKDNYVLENPRKNPFAERMKNGYTIIIDHEPDEDDDEINEQSGSAGSRKRSRTRAGSLARRLRRKRNKQT